MPTQVDDKTWEFKLRSGVSFHNGEPFNADAVVHSVKRVIDPNFNSAQASYFGSVTGAEKVDDLTVRITTSGPDPLLPARMYWMKIVPPTFSADAKFEETPVGTGPYKFAGWTRGSDIVIEANDAYWGEKPSIDKVTYRFLSEAGMRVSSLLAGEVDLVTNLLPEFTSSVPKYEAVTGIETSIIILSTENEATKDVRVRKALDLSIDREALATSLFSGYATPAPGQMTNAKAFGYDASLPPFEYDPEKAKALIKEAGAEGKTVKLLGESGRWLKDRELIEAVAAYWSEAGVNVDIRIEEFGEYLNQLFDQKVRPDAAFVSNSSELFDADLDITFAYESGTNAASNNDKELAAMIAAARTETDVEKRRKLYSDIQKKANEGVYAIPLLSNQDIYGLSPRLEWKPRPDGKVIVSEMKVIE